ncbi:T6SS immunity protein Tli4 family protein [Acinetobacter sp. NIPH 1869]|uniref:T6SS immunity protein Tli4 family protein n=1 Tax=Acinetobacter higginsii TaxID=70347 RepID=UPI001F4AD9CA|nr:T6SS immunity protein Tli4 family protein [Acinetobacter higginsii]MCH7303919.1 T6SS immunity protein Tli4 family protein [Acinetobacter higginsii]
MKLLKSLVLCTLTVISLSACSNVEKQKEGIQVIDYSNPKKVCFGRIEMTVPKETEVEYSNFNYNGSRIEVLEDIKNYDAFKKLIDDKIQSLKSEPHETEGTLLKNEMNGPVQQQDQSISHIIVFRDNKYTIEAYEIYAYLYLRPNKFLILKSGASNDLLDEAITEIQHNLKSIKIRSAKDEEQAGLCWKEFFILDDMSKNIPFTGGYLHFRFPSYPRVRVDIEHRVRLESDRPLIEMVKENEANAPLIFKTMMSTENLREQKKVIHGLAGEEIFGHAHRRGFFERGFESAAWQYLGSLENDNDPFIHYSLESAELVHSDEALQSTISQKAVFQLHDFILNSLQISPNNKKEK